MGMEATGRLHAIYETKQVSERFTKREFVLELIDNPKYPQTVLFQLTGDRVSQLDGLNVGDQVRIEFNLRGREWRSPQGETKYFNSLEVWKLEPARANAGASNSRGAASTYGGASAANSRSATANDPRDRFTMPPREDEPRPGDVDDIPF
jgi:single-stranded DNA-binding protein